MTSEIASTKDRCIARQDQRTEDIGDNGNGWSIDVDAFAEFSEVFKERLHG